MSPKIQTRKNFNLCQNDFIFKRIFELHEVVRYSQRFQATKCSNTLKLHTLEALLSKSRLYFFFLIFLHAEIPP